MSQIISKNSFNVNFFAGIIPPGASSTFPSQPHPHLCQSVHLTKIWLYLVSWITALSTFHGQPFLLQLHWHLFKFHFHHYHSLFFAALSFLLANFLLIIQFCEMPHVFNYMLCCLCELNNWCIVTSHLQTERSYMAGYLSWCISIIYIVICGLKKY